MTHTQLSTVVEVTGDKSKFVEGFQYSSEQCREDTLQMVVVYSENSVTPEMTHFLIYDTHTQLRQNITLP